MCYVSFALELYFANLQYNMVFWVVLRRILLVYLLFDCVVKLSLGFMFFVVYFSVILLVNAPHRTYQSIRFLLFEIKHIFVFNSIIIYFTDLFLLYIFIQNAYANKKVFNKKGYRKSQLSGILTEPLNPRGTVVCVCVVVKCLCIMLFSYLLLESV